VYRLEGDDLRLLIVVDRGTIDNRYFFSPKQRLPDTHARAFAREPFILPAFSLRVMRHAQCETRSLIAGRDVLMPYQWVEDGDERTCRGLERRCGELPEDCEERRLLQAALRGETVYDGLDRDYAYRRYREIRGYRHDLASLGFPYGDLFSKAAYPDGVRYAPAPRILEHLVQNLYTLRRRIENYAYA
jgi:hypothetical protein